MKTATSKLVGRIKRMITMSQKKRKSPDPITAYRAKIEHDCASAILKLVLEANTEVQEQTNSN